MSNFDLPTEYDLQSVKIDGNDVSGLLVSLSVFENIYSPIITGHLTLLETDTAAFIEKYKIEGNEDIEFNVKSGKGSYNFEGVLNGVRNKVNDQQFTTYTFDFTTKEVRKNETTFITKAFKEKNPKDIVTEMIEKMGGKQDKVDGSGKPMTLLPSNKRPYDVIKYVLTHGVVDDANASEGDGKTQEEKSEGNGGFMCWRTADGFRFNTIEKVMKGEAGGDAGEFKSQMMNKGQSIGEMMESIVQYDFQIMGDVQAKLRAGAFAAKHISFDLDKLQYKEFVYDNSNKASQKLSEIAKEISRVTAKPFSNERFENKCDKTQNSKYDQSRYYVSQSSGGENTHDDQQGTLTLYPSLNIRAGDKITTKIAKIEKGQYDKKHSGKYIVSEVAHHFNNTDLRGYTRVSVIRATDQTDDSSS